MGLILLENMEFFAYHGCFKEERIVGNKFLVDLRIDADLSKASVTDNLNDTLNYQAAYKIVKEEMQEKSHLLEHIAQRIIDAIYSTFNGIEAVTVKVSKMNPPLGGKTEKVSVILSK
ncbi:MAG: dihydroneopterin aldolase [Bacteroidales bacterium]|nr:dihydroneopterin aldolase [Bacteroidales bacterium]